MNINIAIGAALAVVSMAVFGQSGVFQCAGGSDGKRLTRDRYDVRLGEHCTGLSPEAVAKMKAEANRPPTTAEQAKMTQRAKGMKSGDLCVELGRVLRGTGATPRQQFWADSIIATAQVPADDQGYIRERRLRIGMTECSVVAALGRPDDVNRTNHAGGRSEQLVYRSKRIYVYTYNGTVTSWQE